MKVYILTSNGPYTGEGINIHTVFSSKFSAELAWKECGGEKYNYDIEEHEVIE